MNDLQRILEESEKLIVQRNFQFFTTIDKIAKPALLLAEKKRPGILMEIFKHHVKVGTFRFEHWPVYQDLKELGFIK